MKIFNKNRYYIRLFINKVEIRDLINEKSISEKPETGFNNNRILIADFQNAKNFLKKVFLDNEFSTKNSFGIIQQMEMSEGGLSEVEKRILLELFSVIGIKEIHINESLNDLSGKQLAEY